MKDLKIYFGADDFIILTSEDDKIEENIDAITNDVKWICNTFESDGNRGTNPLTINADKILYFTVEDHVE